MNTAPVPDQLPRREPSTVDYDLGGAPTENVITGHASGENLEAYDSTVGLTPNNNDPDVAVKQDKTARPESYKGRSILEDAPKNQLRQGSYMLISSAEAEPWFNNETVELPYNQGLIDAPLKERRDIAATMETGAILTVFRDQDEKGGIYYVVGSNEAIERHKENPDQPEKDIKYIMPGQTLQVGRGENAWLPKEAQEREDSTKRPRVSSKQAIFINDGQGNLWLENLGHNPIYLPKKDVVDHKAYFHNKHHKTESSWDENWSEFRVGPQTLGQRLREALSESNELSGLETPYEMRVSSQQGNNDPVPLKEQQAQDASAEYDRSHVFAENVLKSMVARLVSILGGKKGKNGTGDQSKRVARSPKSEK